LFIHGLKAAALAAVLCLGVGIIAQATPATDVEKYLAGLATWSADFTQTIDDGHGKVLRSAAGKLYLQRPGKFRWDYTEPSEQLPASLLSGGGSVSGQFDIKALPRSGGLEWFQLIPKHTDTDFQLVRIGFDKGELASMFLADKLGQVTQLTFTHPSRNATFAPDLFSFTPPPGVDVIGRDLK
jgi:outer membrane lipoprotein carrier protein